MAPIARLQYVREDDAAAPVGAVELLRNWERTVGPPSNLVRLLANEPPLASAFTQLVNALWAEGESPLTPTERELAYTAATVANQCHY